MFGRKSKINAAQAEVIRKLQNELSTVYKRLRWEDELSTIYKRLQRGDVSAMQLERNKAQQAETIRKLQDELKTLYKRFQMGDLSSSASDSRVGPLQDQVRRQADMITRLSNEKSVTELTLAKYVRGAESGNKAYGAMQIERNKALDDLFDTKNRLACERERNTDTENKLQNQLAVAESAYANVLKQLGESEQNLKKVRADKLECEKALADRGIVVGAAEELGQAKRDRDHWYRYATNIKRELTKLKGELIALGEAE